MTEHSVYIGLGSNLDDPAAQLCTALEELAALPRSRVAAASSLYRSPPMGPQDQPDYVNAVAQLQTGLEPEPLLDALQAIEQAHHRRRGQHWGPRTLDLDILLYDDAVIASDRLNIPHPGLARRSFVLYPLAEIAPALQVPGAGDLQALLAQCPRDGLQRINHAG